MVGSSFKGPTIAEIFKFGPYPTWRSQEFHFGTFHIVKAPRQLLQVRNNLKQPCMVQLLLYFNKTAF